MQLAPNAPATSPALPDAPATPPFGDEVLATFSYIIRGPRRVPRVALIEAQGDPTRATRVTGSFDDAVAAARSMSAAPVKDGVHRIPVQPAHAVLQAADGAWWLTRLSGEHRDAVAPLFVDGDFFRRTTLSLQVARGTTQVAAIVGAETVLDLRRNGSATTAPPAKDLETPRIPTADGG